MQFVSRTRLSRQQQFYLDLRSNWGTKTTRLLLKLSWCRRWSYLPCTAAPLQQKLKEESKPLRWDYIGHFWIFATKTMWAASSEFGTYRLCKQRRFGRACASAQSRQNLRCSLIQAVSQEEPSDRKPDPWPLWMAGHAQLKFVMTECSKTQIQSLDGAHVANEEVRSRFQVATGLHDDLSLITRKCVFGDFRPGKIQTRLLSYRN